MKKLSGSRELASVKPRVFTCHSFRKQLRLCKQLQVHRLGLFFQLAQLSIEALCSFRQYPAQQAA